MEILWQRERVEAVVERMRAAPPDCLGLSLYVWSERYSLALARAVRDEWPDCVIVAGGPQVPEDTDAAIDFLLANRLDCVIRGEGEALFSRVLGEWWGRVPKMPLPERADKLDVLPSPYLSGVLDHLVRAHPDVRWQALQETNRGCPYQCTFCDWGSATYDKVRKFPIEQCVAELEWFAQNKIELLYNCDANFGMLEQDVAFTDALVDVSKRTGFPQKFRAAYAKKINDRVFGVAKAISDAGLSKGATISFQSMASDVLQNVKRLNPVEKTLAETFKRYSDAGISTYTEIIVGLPGETYDSFADGIDRLLNAGQHDGINVYPCMALRNSELSTPENRERFGLITREVDLLLLHGEPDVESQETRERYDLVIETASMSHADWRRAWEFAIVVQAMHCGGVMREIIEGVRRECPTLTYRRAYEHVIRLNRMERNREMPLAYALRWWDEVLDKALAGGAWETVLPGFGSVQWPPEEAVRLIVTKLRYPNLTDDWETWAREVVWYGRKGGVKKNDDERRAA